MSLADQLPSCTVSGPLLPLPDPTYGRFTDEQAQAQYDAFRSPKASTDTTTLHLVGPSGSAVGFVSYRIAHEDLGSWVALYASVEYAFIERRWRGCGYMASLLQPMVAEIDALLRSRTLPRHRVKVHSVGYFPNRFGARVEHSLRRELKRVVDKRPFVTFADHKSQAATPPDGACAFQSEALGPDSGPGWQ